MPLSSAGVAPGSRPMKGAVFVRRTVWVSAGLALVVLAACTAVMLPLRHDLTVATPALVLVLPVLVAVVLGGFVPGAALAVCGFLVYDWCFLRPYSTLEVSSPQDWTAIVVYLVVALVVARILAARQLAGSLADSREDAVRRLFVVSEHLIAEQSLDKLLEVVTTTVHETFATRWVALLLPHGDTLEVASTAGDLTDAERAEVVAVTGTPQALALMGDRGDVSRIALTTLQRPVGQLVVAGARLTPFDRRVLGAFANQAALAIERNQLQALALRNELLEEVDRWRSALVGAVSHDLRTPLSAIKAAVGTLRDPAAVLSEADHEELLAMVEHESDHLTRLVSNLLDMVRIESGALRLHSEPHPVSELVTAGLAAARSALEDHVVRVDLDGDLPLVEVDVVLIAQVLANLLANAAQHAPEHSTIAVSAADEGAQVAISVRDEGPGVPEADREAIFHMVGRTAGSGRAGLGLAISTAFVEAHGARLTVADAPGGGAVFTFRVPVALLEAAS
jgi:two-component system sensor histidine kinase KdpD